MRYYPFFILALFTSHCGVEAGNVGKGRTGQVKILFAQETASSGESLSVEVSSLGLIDSADSEAATLNASKTSIDLYGSSSTSVLVAESSEIPAGSYAKVAIRLKGDKPVHYRDENGREHDVQLDDDTKESFFITQAIEVVEGEVTTIVVNLDPYQSLSRPADDSFVFKPRGEVARHNQSYVGATAVTGARWACLYAYEIKRRPIGPRDGGGPESPVGFGPGDEMHRLREPERGREVEGRPSTDTKDKLMRDETSECSRAYGKTSVKEGKFEFKFLDEGAYAVRIFANDGTYTDLTDDIVVKRED